MLTINIGQETFTLTDEEEKALLTDMISIKDWIENALRVKAHQVMDRAIEENTEYNPRKLDETKKRQIISSLTLETAVDKQKRLDKELNSG